MTTTENSRRESTTDYHSFMDDLARAGRIAQAEHEARMVAGVEAIREANAETRRLEFNASLLAAFAHPVTIAKAAA